MKIGEYEQMMSWLTRPEAPTPIEPRENLKGGTDPKTGMGFQKGNTMGQGRAKDLIGKPSINVEGKNQYIPRTTKEIADMFRINSKDKYKNLFYVGAGTHPGAGVPGVINSAKAVEKILYP